MGIKNLDVYHWLITTSIISLVLVIISSYVLVNLIFAIVYFLIGPQNFGGLDSETASQQFVNLFFFSAQTITTLGYGHIYPVGNAASIAAAIESLLGLLTFALATGVLYGRFSRPKAHCFIAITFLFRHIKMVKVLCFVLLTENNTS